MVIQDWAVYRTPDLMALFGCSEITLKRWLAAKKLPPKRDLPGGRGWFGKDIKEHFGPQS